MVEEGVLFSLCPICRGSNGDLPSHSSATKTNQVFLRVLCEEGKASCELREVWRWGSNPVPLGQGPPPHRLMASEHLL